mmetsp:Transcript_20310/g.40542  ORF Transcript_20310/g.40542 Transcript_20310/m.40542 type:complete len:285 (-) Transcript_20310:78-932(-)
MSSGSDSDNDTLNTTDSNIEDGRFDAWMNGSSQGVQKYNMDAFSTLRQQKFPLQRLHLGVTKEVLHHRKISTFRPSPLVINDTSTTSLHAQTYEKTPAVVKSYVDLSSSTGSNTSDIKIVRDVSPVPFVHLSPEKFSHSQQESPRHNSTKRCSELVLQELKEIKCGQKELMETQEKILCSQTVFYGLISDFKKTASLKCNSDACAEDQKEAKVHMDSKDFEKSVQKGRKYNQSEIFVARLHQKLTKDELMELIFEAGLEKPDKKKTLKDVLIQKLFPHLEDIFA